MQCPGFFLKSFLESPRNLLEICSVKFVDTVVMNKLLFMLYVDIDVTTLCFIKWNPFLSTITKPNVDRFNDVNVSLVAGGNWQVILCDPMWQVIPRSSVTGFPLKNLMLNQCFNFF